MLDWCTVHCPYCGEGYATAVDLSAGDRCYTEDCAVCCRPIVLALRVDADGALAGLSSRREQD